MKLPADYDYEGTPAYEEIRAETRQRVRNGHLAAQALDVLLGIRADDASPTVRGIRGRSGSVGSHENPPRK